jgi:hypothetical protein
MIDDARKALADDIEHNWAPPISFTTEQLTLIVAALRSQPAMPREEVAKKLAEFDGNKWWDRVSSHDKGIYRKRADAILSLPAAPADGGPKS